MPRRAYERFKLRALRTLFLLPFSDVRRSALFGVVAMALTLSACGSDTAQESLIEALADVDGLEVEIDDDTLVYSVRGRGRVSVVVGSGASVPSGFPEDVLVYEGEAGEEPMLP